MILLGMTMFGDYAKGMIAKHIFDDQQ